MSKLLFCSYHCYLDPSSGAALCTRDLFELLVRRGWPCAVFCGPRLDFEEQTSIEQLLAGHRLSFETRRTSVGPCEFSLYHFVQGNVPATVYWPQAETGPVPSRAEGEPFLALFEDALNKFRPDILLTYGGHWLAREVMALAKRRGLAVVFWLHNLEYKSAEPFRNVDAILVPSRFAKEHYQQTLGLECTAIPGPWNWDRIRCNKIEGRYVTFVNPQPHKGVFVFARIAHELGQRRPDIPFLVVEGRAKAAWLGQSGLDFSGHKNLFHMANTPDPRNFYSVSRIVLMPSLWRESFPRVAVEACINGIPVLASNRGGLPETLADAGLLFDLPERYTPESRATPSAKDVLPWMDAIFQLWDDAAFYERERQRALAAAEGWRPEALAVCFEEFFRHTLNCQHPPESR